MTYAVHPITPSGHRIHIFGPSGSGTSTLGRALAQELATQHFDTDDFYWEPTDPPFTVKRPAMLRRTLMRSMFVPRRDWVLSGSMSSWAGDIPERFTLAVHLVLDPGLRRMRLEAREAMRCDCGRGWGEAHCPRCTAFLCWADGYEAGHRPGRSLTKHLAWARTLPCPVITLDSAEPVESLTRTVMAQLDHAAAVA